MYEKVTYFRASRINLCYELPLYWEEYSLHNNHLRAVHKQKSHSFSKVQDATILYNYDTLPTPSMRPLSLK